MDLLKRLTSIYQNSSSEGGSEAGSDRSATRDQSARDGADGGVPTEYTSKSDEFVGLLERNDGRMKQADIVSQTDWSSATVSRVLSEMETEGTIRKISVGRENVITLNGAEPDWYSPPPEETEAPEHWSDQPGNADDESAILVVEDNPADARILKEAMREADIPNPVHVVQDGSDALEFILQRGQYADAPRPRLVLLDLSLLMVDGIEVLRELDERQPFRGVPLLVLSRSEDPEDVRNAYEHGATAYLTKPDEFSALVDLVDTIDDFWLSQTVSPAIGGNH